MRSGGFTRADLEPVLAKALEGVEKDDNGGSDVLNDYLRRMNVTG